MFFIQVLVATMLMAPAFAGAAIKRGIFEGSFGSDFHSFSGDFGPSITLVRPHAPSSGEIASAIQAAKEASANVMAAQHRVQDAKDDVLHQHHLANHKQAQAALALQRTEAAAAVQQQEAKSAANSLVQAQQRLAHAKSEVAELQRIASAKEAHAAAIIQKSASAAAAEIQRSDDAAKKISALQHSSSASLKHVAAGKEGSLSATSAAVAAAAERSGGGHVTWVPAPNVVHLNPWG